MEPCNSNSRPLDSDSGRRLRHAARDSRDPSKTSGVHRHARTVSPECLTAYTATLTVP
jgi:hypothetical protein